MANIKFINLGSDSIPQELKDLAKSLGAEIVSIDVGVEVEEDGNCGCVPCTMRREFAAKYPGRSPLHHPDLTLVEDADGIAVRDVIRYRLFKDPNGNTMFFNALFHPTHELNLYVCEMERMAIEDFHVEPILEEDGKVAYRSVDFRYDERFEMENVQGTLTTQDGRTVNVTALAGPDFEEAVRNRLAQAH